MVELEESEYASEERRSYGEEPQGGSRGGRAGRGERSRGQSPEQQVHRSRRSTITDGKYLNLYADGRKKGFALNGKLPVVIGAVVVLALLAVVVNLTLCSQPQEEPDQIPVTGLDDGQGSNDQGQQAPLPTPPTQFTLAYNVKDGQSTYIEVYVDGKLQEAADVSGPASKQFASADSIRFVCSEPAALTLSIDGEEQQLEPGSSDIVNETFTFSKVLEDWYAQHPEVPRASDGASGASTSATAAGSGSAADTSQTGGSSSTTTTSGAGSQSGTPDADDASGTTPESDSSSSSSSDSEE